VLFPSLFCGHYRYTAEGIYTIEKIKCNENDCRTEEI
jgi:hypothetical protein